MRYPGPCFDMDLDYEKGLGPYKVNKNVLVESIEKSETSGPAPPVEKKNVLERFGNKLKAENKGVERITDEEKTDSRLWPPATMWLSANLVLPGFSIGATGITTFSLSFWEAVPAIVCFNLLGVLSVAFFSIFGAKLGLRQMVVTKFFLGNLGMRLFAFINLVVCVGWGAVNIMNSAQLLNIVNNGALPPWAGCLIIIICTIIVTFFGYHVIHYYEMVSWIPNLAVLIAIICRMAMSGKFESGEMHTGKDVAGNVLTYGGAVYGFATGWTTYASDYTTYQPRHDRSWRIFGFVFCGVMIPCCFVMIIGAACATGTLNDETWNQYYKKDSIGGLVYSVLVVDSLHGFGQFLCVVFALSAVANNIPNMYSISLSAQAVWSKLALVPRYVWSIAGNFITLAICIPAFYYFEPFMDNFMNIMSYYLAIYQGMCLSEHFIWRKGDMSQYNYLEYRDPKATPVGIAAIFGFCCGAAGVAVGMNQTYYMSVLASKIGKDGGDIGFELAFGFAFVGFNLVRPFEKKYLGR